jgi:hypothetical protein
MHGSSSLIFAAASMFSWGVSLVVSLTFIVVIATVVRRYRPDAAPILIGALVFELLITVYAAGASVILARITSTSMGIEGYAQAQAISTSVIALLHASARALLLWGIVRLARPADVIT